MQIKYTYLLLLSCFVFFSNAAQNSPALNSDITLITSKNEFTAGEVIVVAFTTTKNTEVLMYCSNSYGSTVVKPVIESNHLYYTIPKHLTTKIGVLNWKLITDTALTGTLKITSIDKPISMESYLGPPSIEAGRKDFTMLVVIPTDSLDNPLKENTKVSIQTQFLSKEKTTQVLTKNLISYKNIYSPTKSGRMLVSSVSLGLDSKESYVDIMPAIPRNFKVFSKRNHAYADGNQITTFYTSILKDKNNNVISDGSFVDFFITNKKGNVLKTSGATINGIAFAKMIHPDYEETWKVKAYVVGIAESNTLRISYKKAIENFEVVFSENNRDIQVGPFKSFMNQIIPDGLQIKLAIYKDNKVIKNLFKTSRNGFASFNLNANIFKNNIYDIRISAAGIEQTFQSKKLW